MDVDTLMFAHGSPAFSRGFKKFISKVEIMDSPTSVIFPTPNGPQMKATRVAMRYTTSTHMVGAVEKLSTKWRSSIAADNTIEYIRVEVPMEHAARADQEIERLTGQGEWDNTWHEGPLRSMASKGCYPLGSTSCLY